MKEEQIKQLITSGWPFFTVTTQGDVLARYVLSGPVFRWSWNRMIPTPLQDSDLCWLLHAAAEEGHPIGDPARDAAAVKAERKSAKKAP
jgi:hypothetical protein